MTQAVKPGTAVGMQQTVIMQAIASVKLISFTISQRKGGYARLTETRDGAISMFLCRCAADCQCEVRRACNVMVYLGRLVHCQTTQYGVCN